jgi:hypothetical protein
LIHIHIGHTQKIVVVAKVIHYALLASYEEYGEQGSTELKEKVLKLLGEHG